jgi:hypothetical protein
MSLQQTKILLEKINALYKSMSLDNGNIAGIERDLMLSYVRQLYDAFLHLEKNGNSADPSPQVEERRPSPPPPPEPAPEPKVERYVPEPKPAPRPEPKPEPAPAPVTRAPEPPPPAPAPEPVYEKPGAAIESLFKQGSSKELSDRLGDSRIDDLTKAMAINDRLLFANDLFGKDMRGMMDTLQELNRLRSMDEAKPLLVQLAQRYDWTEEDREDTARSFIKLVRRKYV